MEKTPKYYCSICLMIRDEGAYLREWIDYYRIIGVDHFYIYDHLSNPPLKSIIQDHIDSGLVTYHYDTREKMDSIKGKNLRPQIPIYNECLKVYGKDNTWIGYFDTDEFLVLKQHLHIRDFLKNYEQYGSLVVCWYLFGSNGHITKQESVIKAYTKREPTLNLYKCFVRPPHVKIVGVHFIYEHEPGYYTVDETKKRLNLNKVMIPINGSANFAQLNHYILRSQEDYDEKVKRGGGTNHDIRKKELFDEINNITKVEDFCIFDLLKKIKTNNPDNAFIQEFCAKRDIK